MAQPEVQAYTRREWRGPLLSKVNDGSYDLFTRLQLVVVYLLSLVLNICALPLSGLCPPLETLVFDWLSRRTFEATERRVEADARSCEMAMFTASKSSKGCKAMGKLKQEEEEAAEENDTPAREQPFRLVDMYLLRTPSFKFSVRLLFTVCMIVGQQSTNPVKLKQPGEESFWLVALIWAIGGCVEEYRQFSGGSIAKLKYEILSFFHSDSPSEYRSDVFNLTDGLGFHLLFLSLILPTPDYNHAAVGLWSVATILAWLRLIIVLELDASLGPVVVMCVKMIGDVSRAPLVTGRMPCPHATSQPAASDARRPRRHHSHPGRATAAPPSPSAPAGGQADGAHLLCAVRADVGYLRPLQLCARRSELDARWPR